MDVGSHFRILLLVSFFVVALWTRRRAWFSLWIAIALNYLCKTYFAVGDMAASHICLQWMCCFVAGGVIYLYKDCIIQWNRRHPRLDWVSITVGLLLTLTFFPAWGQLFSTVKSIGGFALIMVGALTDRRKLLANTFTRIISDISLEIYLSHVFILRVIQKVGIIQRLSNPTIAYVVTVLFTVFGSIVFAVSFRFLSVRIKQKEKVF